MLDLKTELNASGIPFEPLGWVKAPAYPYGIFTDEMTIRGSDLPSMCSVITHNVSIELYHNNYDQLLQALTSINQWARSRALDARVRCQYISDEDHYCATLTTTITEKERMIIDGGK